MAALFDSDHTTCEALSTAMALSAGEELTFDLPYYANSDHCFSNFYVNITYGFSGSDEYDVYLLGSSMPWCPPMMFPRQPVQPGMCVTHNLRGNLMEMFVLDLNARVLNIAMLG